MISSTSFRRKFARGRWIPTLTIGCYNAISTSSVVSELAIGKSIKEATKLTDDDVIRELGGIPEQKQHCSLLGVQGLRAAIADYLLKENHRKYSARIEKYQSPDRVEIVLLSTFTKMKFITPG